MDREEADMRIARKQAKNRALEWLEGTQESQRTQVMLEVGVWGWNSQDILSSSIFPERLS